MTNKKLTARAIYLFFCLGLTNAFGQTTELDKQKLEIEKQKIILDREKFEFDKKIKKENATFEVIKSSITAVAVVIPILIAVYSVRSQIKMTREVKSIETKYNLLLKATEIVMEAKNPQQVKGKAEVVKEILKGQLPEDFIESFDPKKFTKPGPGFDVKFELLKLILNNPDSEKQIVELYLRMFPADKIENIFPKDFLEKT